MPILAPNDLGNHTPTCSYELVIAHSSMITLTGLKAITDTDINLKVTDTFDRFNQAIECVQQYKPDIFITDLCFDEKSILSQLNKVPDKTRIIAFTDHSAVDIVQHALNNRVLGYIMSTSDPSNLNISIREVSQGHTYVDPLIGSRLLRKHGAGCLAPREVEVLRLSATGHSTDEIAKLIYVSPRTVEACRSSLKRKLSLSSRSQMYLFAQANGYLSDSCSCLEESLK